ncbi:metacaspase-9-like [Magnolia sinica]|uniref:metacaspase-9-like n=1 Tax=Magnolia sinica TaxID=86752 RepID=UPI002657BDD1|nr:metacaspase-9-like [Magnolia sinica]
MGRKVALLVGCNYSGNPKCRENGLYGCINDVKAMQGLIRHRFGFLDGNITILTDETQKQPTQKQPTRLNILDELNKMIDAANPGDTLLFYFSGGGALVNRPVNPPVTNEIKRGKSAIIPCDLKPITGADMVAILNRLPDGAFFTFICDSSYSGGLFDENVQTESNVPDHANNCNFKSKTIPSNLLQSINVSENLPAGIPPPVILFSSSRWNEESVEVHLNCDVSMAFSAYSGAIQKLFNSPQAGNGLNAPYANREVDAFTRASLGYLGFDQHPCLIPNKNNAVALFLNGYGPGVCRIV